MRETKSARLTRMHDEYDILRQVIPAPACALHFSNPLELLIATVLSAQTTDKPCQHGHPGTVRHLPHRP